MPGAISIAANNSSKDQITALWDRVSKFEDQPSMRALEYPPHFTFAIYQNLEPSDFHKEVIEIAMRTRAIRVTFNKICYFDASPLVLWAVPENDNALSKLHTGIHNTTDPKCCDEHYRPHSWIAHCTLGTRIQEAWRDDAVAFSMIPFKPFEVIFDTIDLIEYPPVQIVDSINLTK